MRRQLKNISIWSGIIAGSIVTGCVMGRLLAPILLGAIDTFDYIERKIRSKDE